MKYRFKNHGKIIFSHDSDHILFEKEIDDLIQDYLSKTIGMQNVQETKYIFHYEEDVTYIDIYIKKVPKSSFITLDFTFKKD